MGALVGVVLDERGAEAFFALSVDARSHGLEVLDGGEDGELLGDGEERSGFCQSDG